MNGGANSWSESVIGNKITLRLTRSHSPQIRIRLGAEANRSEIGISAMNPTTIDGCGT